ncbi:mtDNA inheritance, partitioning of the mitochondrial organelle [Blastocladiella emersonii ATCC 22665]|nr:mtDNA inheritance, partitioning of the mitochondrial organelle [Blastocladiella emersonii ATCC 22665]
MREILTVQLGSHANYAATHFWNAQCAYPADSDALDHGVFFRSGRTFEGEESITPRTIVVDFRDAMGSVAAEPSVDIEAERAAASSRLWGGSLDAIVQPASAPSEYHAELERDGLPQNSAEYRAPDGHRLLDPARVRSWADYLHSYLHPRSLAPLTRPLAWDAYDAGTDLAGLPDWLDAVVESQARFFMEEADSPQGLVVLADADGGWAGVAGALLPLLADEYPKKSFLVHTLTSAEPAHHWSLARLTAALADSFDGTSGYTQHLVGVNPAARASPGAQYLGTAAIGMALDVLAAPLRSHHAPQNAQGFGPAPRSLADLTQLLYVGGSSRSPFTTARLWSPPVAAGLAKAGMHPAVERDWISLAAPLALDSVTTPDAELYIRVGAPDPAEVDDPRRAPRNATAAVPLWQPRCMASASLRVTSPHFPRAFPFPYVEPMEDDEACAVHWTASRAAVAPLVRSMAASVRRDDVDVAEQLLGMVENDESYD